MPVFLASLFCVYAKKKREETFFMSIRTIVSCDSPNCEKILVFDSSAPYPLYDGQGPSGAKAAIGLLGQKGWRGTKGPHLCSTHKGASPAVSSGNGATETTLTSFLRKPANDEKSNVPVNKP
jgi:hypothetical protein